jgi:hypothetical protein
LSKYDQNLNSFNSKKYIDNVIKVPKLFDLENESQEISIKRTSQNLDINIKKAPNLTNMKVEVNSTDNGIPKKQTEINGFFHPSRLESLTYPSEQGVYRGKENIISPNPINICIRCINNYSIKYIAKLLEVNHIKTKQRDTVAEWATVSTLRSRAEVYLIKDLSNIILRPTNKSKIRPKKRGIVKQHRYDEKRQIPLFFIK